MTIRGPRVALPWVGLSLALGLVGCQPRERDLGAFETEAPARPAEPASTDTEDAGADAGHAASTESGAASEETDASTGGEDDGDGLRLDVSHEPTEAGCKKADFLFVIDGSYSMIQDQRKLIASFPGFIDAILTTTEAEDFRILVTDVDALAKNINGDCAQFCRREDVSFCRSQPCDPRVPKCEYTLGAGRRLALDYATDCGIAGDRRWMEATQPDLHDTFACVAEIGGHGDAHERVADAMLAALGPESAPGGCNEGFVRDDAILVITVITDDADDTHELETREYVDELIRIKRANAQAIVFIAFINDYDQDPSTCPKEHASEGIPHHLRGLAETFEGAWTNICEPDYGAFLARQVGTVGRVCSMFTPAR